MGRKIKTLIFSLLCPNLVVGQCNTQFTESVAEDGSCICKDAYYGERCDQFENYDLECDQSFVNVKVKLAAFESVGITAANQLFLNDPECQGVAGVNDDGDDIVVFTVTGSPASCGAVVKSNGTTIQYSNTIRDNDITNDPTMTTRSKVQLGFHCSFPVDYRVALPGIMPTVSTVAIQTSRGSFVVNMDMYSNDEYTTKMDLSKEVRVAKGDWLHLQMKLMNKIDDGASNLIAEQCWATPVPQPHSDAPDDQAAYHNIMLSGCPADSSVNVFYNGDNDKVQFKVQMFGFRSGAPSVYLHCVVRVCGQNCRQNCGVRKRSTDEVDDRHTDIAVVTSPEIIIYESDEVHVEEIKELQPYIDDSFDATLVYILSAILILVVFAIFAAALMIHQKSRVSLLDETEESSSKKNNANAGTAFSSAFRG
jgi:hypothetical protein